MIYISSSCLRTRFIWESVEKLVKNGFNNIELSGGNEYHNESIDRLIDLKVKFNINYRCHNYFPPPKVPFVLNLSSKSEDILDKSKKMINESIKLSRIFGADKYGFHAGFLTDISSDEIGIPVSKKKLINRQDGIDQFMNEFNLIKEKNSDIDLYIENNVVSANNYKNFEKKNCFLMTDSEEILNLKEKYKFNLLLDVGHLYVSCNTLSKNFKNEFNKLIKVSDYIHISDNNGFSDENKSIVPNSQIGAILSKSNLGNKTFTLEVNDGIDAISESYNFIENLYD